MQRTLKRELKVPEIAKKEAIGRSIMLAIDSTTECFSIWCLE